MCAELKARHLSYAAGAVFGTSDLVDELIQGIVLRLLARRRSISG